EKYMESFMDGFYGAENEFFVKLIGGNLTGSDKIFVDITALGEVKKENIVKREGASVGDKIFVSGTLGDSALGLKVLKSNKTLYNGHRYLVERHKMPSPRLALGKELAVRNLATSMIDVSDGLLLDLSRISTEFELGADINLSSIPLSDDYKGYITELCGDEYEPALSGGEDYELLFTSSEENSAKISALSKELGIQITDIGSITDSAKINLINNDGTKIEVEKRGYVHFST
nr:thiamine-phosphate kinase [Candidatus Dadabacteria bacterium]